MESIPDALPEPLRASLEKHDHRLRERRLRDWARELGVPGRPVVVAFQHGDFHVEAVGVTANYTNPAPGRFVVTTDDGTTMIAWGVRIRRAGCQAFLEARFDPESDVPPSLQNLDLFDPDANARVLAGLDLLRAWRPPGGRPADCLERIETTANEMAMRGIKLTQDNVAEQLHVDVRTVQQCYRRERKRTGRNWDQTRQAALSRAGQIA